MKVLIKPMADQFVNETLLLAMCSENDCNCGCSTDNGNTKTNNGSSEITEENLLF